MFILTIKLKIFSIGNITMKFIILSMLIALVLEAESYEALLNQALKNNIQ